MLDPGLLVVLGQSQLADAEPDLGHKLMRAFLEQLLEADRQPARIFVMGTGIFLSTEGSAVLDLLQRHAAAGAEIASCLTCLDYYGRRDQLRVGQEGNMKQAVQWMLEASKILAP